MSRSASRFRPLRVDRNVRQDPRRRARIRLLAMPPVRQRRIQMAMRVEDNVHATLRPRHPCVVLVMVEDKAMSAQEFRDDDASYLAWLDTHPHGFVLNIARSHHATAARAHHASCRTISGANP